MAQLIPRLQKPNCADLSTHVRGPPARDPAVGSASSCAALAVYSLPLVPRVFASPDGDRRLKRSGGNRSGGTGSAGAVPGQCG